MKDFSFFPQLIVGLIASIVGITVIPQLLAPYLPAVFVVICLFSIAWLAGRANKRSKR